MIEQSNNRRHGQGVKRVSQQFVDFEIQAREKWSKFILAEDFGSIGLTDIIRGSSIGCIGLDAHFGLKGPVVRGWEATTGWDPVTGLDTPNLEALVVAAEV